MKKEIIFEILRKIETKKSLKRKLKIFAIVGILGFFMTAAITIWIGFKAVNYVASKTMEVNQSPLVKVHIENLKSDFTALSRPQVVSYWSKLQSLIAGLNDRFLII